MHDISISAEALRSASNWAMEGENAAPVQLLVIDGVLFAYQGDEHAAYDSTGTLVESSSVEFVKEPKLNQHLLLKLEILQAALRHLAEPNRGARPNGGDAINMADYARAELDKAEAVGEDTIASTPGVCPHCGNRADDDSTADYFDNVEDEYTYCYECGQHATNPRHIKEKA